MNSRNKIGGLVDRRFGENDPTMTPEERAAERFARESQRKMRKESMFNLEDDEEEMQLTHMGQSLTFDGPNQDDFDAGDLEEEQSDDEASRKRKRFPDGEEGQDEDQEDFIDYEDGEEQPGRKKTKAEVMKEVIAKSKFYKAERQQLKDDDEDLREALDKELPDLFDALRGMKAPSKAEAPKQDFSEMNPERAAMLEQSQNKDPEKEYDQRLRQMTFDQRSKPTDRTKTEEEKAEEEAERLKKLESDRLRRMRGEQLTDDEDENMDMDELPEDDDESEIDDATHFGLPAFSADPRPEMAVEDEDDFIIDDDLVETNSNASLEIGESDIEEDSSDDESEGPDGEDELINGMTLPTDAFATASTAIEVNKESNGKLAFTYPCPKDHDSFLAIVKNVPVEEIPTVIQRIRALHHPRLKPGNKDKLGRFAEVLVEHVSYMANEDEQPPFAILENIIRHIHSLAKMHPLNVTIACRARLREIGKERPLNLLPGDLILLTAVSTIFPTSDHFHSTVTPAHLCLARYLGQCSITSLVDLAHGAYASSLCLQYQTISKRYMPEFINYTLNAISNLAPTEIATKSGAFPYRKSQESVQLVSSKKATPRKLQFRDLTTSSSDHQAQEDLKISLLNTFVSLLGSASDTWAEKSAFIEIFTPVRTVLKQLRSSLKSKVYAATRDIIQSVLNKIDAQLAQARLVRRPLFLHNHKPLAIKTAIPKFEENFNPDKHYDPDRERAESNRLKKEFKREKKGAMRELRKDASFIAREKLREKKERDAEYETKYRRLVAEIQSQEGRAANEYERARGRK
jgi:nucleolar protein 14